MRYVVLIYGDETWTDGLSDEEQGAHMQRWGEYDQALRGAGIVVGGDALDRTPTARTVRGGGGKPIVTDGPFAETREQLGGFIELDVDTIDEAVAWAQRVPGARTRGRRGPPCGCHVTCRFRAGPFVIGSDGGDRRRP